MVCLSLSLLLLAEPAATCPPGTITTTDSTFWNGWGVDLENTRFQPAAMAKLKAGDFPRLSRKWAVRADSPAPPALVGGRLYFGVGDGTVYSIDAGAGCVLWTYKAGAPVATSITIAGTRHNRYTAYFADAQANVHAVDAATGKPVWKKQAGQTSPKLHGESLYVSAAAASGGAVVSLDASTGAEQWRTETGPVTATPAIDASRDLLYAAGSSLAAIELRTGKIRWTNPVRATAAPVLLRPGALLAGDASGTVAALDLDREGAVAWKRKVASAGVTCIAAGSGKVFVAAGSLYALSAKEGKPLWRASGPAQWVTATPDAVLAGAAGRVAAFDSGSGRLLWQAKVDAGSPVIAAGMLFVNSKESLIAFGVN